MMLKRIFYFCISTLGFGQDIDLESYLLSLKEKFPLIQQIQAEDFKKEKNFFLFDTRSLKEYQISRIANAEFIDYENPDFGIFETIDKKSTIVLYCSVGYRSSVIAEKLKEHGFTNVFNLYGGIFNWANIGFNLENMDNQITRKLHSYDKKWGTYISNTKIIKVY
jgi:rhodanese-related sulfurtransferase